MKTKSERERGTEKRIEEKTAHGTFLGFKRGIERRETRAYLEERKRRQLTDTRKKSEGRSCTEHSVKGKDRDESKKRKEAEFDGRKRRQQRKERKAKGGESCTWHSVKAKGGMR